MDNNSPYDQAMAQARGMTPRISMPSFRQTPDQMHQQAIRNLMLGLTTAAPGGPFGMARTMNVGRQQLPTISNTPSDLLRALQGVQNSPNIGAPGMQAPANSNFAPAYGQR